MRFSFLTVLYTALVAMGVITYALIVAVYELVSRKNGKENIKYFDLHSREWDLRNEVQKVNFRCKRCDEKLTYKVDKE